MAVVSVDEVVGQRHGTLSKDYNREYTRFYQVITNSVDDNAATVLAMMTAGGGGSGSGTLPALADAFPGDSNALLQDVDPQSQEGEDTQLLWLVSCKYSTKDNFPTDPDPTLIPAKISWESRDYREGVATDLDGDQVATSAYEPFDPQAEKFVGYLVASVELNVSSDRSLTMGDHLFKVNSATWRGRAAKRCQIVSYSTSEQDANGVTYWKEQWKVEVKKTADADYEYFLDAGFVELVGGDPVQITDAQGQPRTKPALLDGSGGVNAVGAAPTFIGYRFYDSVDFATLGF